MEVVIFAFIVFGAIAVAIAYNSPERKLKRRLREAPAFSLAQVPEGQEARVIGQAQLLRDHMRAPLSGRPCLAWVAEVEQQQTNGKTSYWRTIIREIRIVPFMLLDGTGRAIVEGAGARLTLNFDNNSMSGFFDNPTEAEKAFLARHHTSGKGLIFNRSLRYKEAVIEIGETVAILGVAVREPDPQAAPADYRGHQPTLVRLTSSPRFPLIISDDPSTTRRPPPPPS